MVLVYFWYTFLPCLSLCEPVCVRVCVYTHILQNTHSHMLLLTYLYTHTLTLTYLPILIHTHIHAYIHTRSLYTHSHIHTHIQTFIHSHIHTQMIYTSRENCARWESASFYRWEDQVLELVQDDMQSRSFSCMRSIPGPLSPFGTSPFSSDAVLQGLRSSGRGRTGKTRPFSECPLAELFLWLFSTCTMLPLGVFWLDWEPIHCWLKPCCSSMADSMESLAQKPDGNKLFQLKKIQF